MTGRGFEPTPSAFRIGINILNFLLPGTVTCDLCVWNFKTDTVYNRIPSTITQIECQSPNTPCRGNGNYACHTINAYMVVGYIAPLGNSTSLLYKQNTTISIGCSCIQRSSSILQSFQPPPVEKRSQGRYYGIA